MTYCGNCGTQTPDEVKFCPSCGKEMEASAKRESSVYSPPVMPGAPRQAAIGDAHEGKTMAILAYILFFIPLLTGAHRTSPFIKYHTNQGTVLFIAALIWSIAYGILTTILAFIPVIGWALIIILGLTGFAFLIFCIVGIINAANGTMRPLPIIGGITIIQ